MRGGWEVVAEGEKRARVTSGGHSLRYERTTGTMFGRLELEQPPA